jgi:hypothetical protein
MQGFLQSVLGGGVVSIVVVPIGLLCLGAAIVQAARAKEAGLLVTIGWLAFALVMVARLIAFNHLLHAGAGHAVRSLAFLNLAQALQLLAAPLVLTAAAVAVSIVREKKSIVSNPRLALFVLFIMLLAIVLLFENTVVRAYHVLFSLP